MAKPVRQGDAVRRAMLLGLDASLADLVPQAPPARPRLSVGNSLQQFEVIDCRIEMQRERIDVASYGSSGHEFMAGPMRATFRLRLWSMKEPGFFLDTLVFDEIMGDRRIRAELLVREYQMISLAGSAMEYQVTAEAVGPILNTPASEDAEEPEIVAAPAERHRRGMKLTGGLP